MGLLSSHYNLTSLYLSRRAERAQSGWKKKFVFHQQFSYRQWSHFVVKWIWKSEHFAIHEGWLVVVTGNVSKLILFLVDFSSSVDARVEDEIHLKHNNPDQQNEEDKIDKVVGRCNLYSRFYCPRSFDHNEIKVYTMKDSWYIKSKGGKTL